MPNGTVLSIFTRSRRGLLTTICASVTLLYLALVIALACAWPPSAPVPSSDNASAFSFIDRTALNCIFGIVFSFWGVMAYLRCLDPRISRRLAAIAVILTLWLTAVTIKWNTTDLKLARYLWYGYYIPMACLPPLCLSCALKSAGIELGKTAVRLKTACIALGIVLAVLALTNDVHRLFFTFDVPNPGLVGMYSYGPAYWAFFAYNTLYYLAFFCVLWRSSRSAMRGLVVPAATVATAGLLFCAAYALRAKWAVSFNFSLVYGIIVMVTLELCLDLGLIPSTRSFKKVFDDLPFDLKILSRNGSLYHQTKVAGPLNANAVNRANHGTPGSFRLPDLPDSLFIVWPLSGGTALLTQDMSGLNELNRTLGKQGTELKRDLEALEHDRELVELLTELEVKSR
ncbi:histidine kinase N-terminal 7TM domain-containing protein, partial [Bifidobacterium dentium]